MLSAFQPFSHRHSCQIHWRGNDFSLALAWWNAPEGIKRFAMICHSPDAPLVQNGKSGFMHWVLYSLPASPTSLKEATPLQERLR
ncbi:hypothetical protein [Vreelandella neptunia]|uniref:hypothetical protein n=1 Tax=Vreelandella neptunia TaxID=115551 RepID=UPI00315ADEC0